MDEQRIQEFNRQAPGILQRAGDVIGYIPRRFIVIPQDQQINDISELISKIRSKALRKLFINLITIIFVILSAYRFLNSEFYYRMVSSSGHAMFIQQYSHILVYVFNITKFLQKYFPAAYNTINMVVPAASTKLVTNFILDPAGTLNRYKTLGFRKTNLISIGGASLIGIGMNTGKIPGSRLLSTVTSWSVDGLKMFLNKTVRMNVRSIEIAYGTASALGWRQIRNYIESMTGEAIRHGIVSLTTVIAGEAGSAATSVYLLGASNNRLRRNLERIGINQQRINNGAQREQAQLANRPHQN